MSSIIQKTKRGDTLIEVMIALAIFAIVAIITVGSMNAGLIRTENSLELTIARNELNAQAEALRFIHSSYISELTLPLCGSGDSITTKCQQYKALWENLTSNSNVMTSSTSSTLNKLTIKYPLTDCKTAYDSGSSDYLVKNRAFVINTRQLLTTNNYSFGGYTSNDAIIRANSNPTKNLFFPAPLNARIIYSDWTGLNGEDNGGNNSATGIQSLTAYTRVARVEGIWVIAVRDSTGPTTSRPKYYDFYIQTCWNDSNSKSPTSLDTIVRLYNPEKS